MSQNQSTPTISHPRTNGKSERRFTENSNGQTIGAANATRQQPKQQDAPDPSDPSSPRYVVIDGKTCAKTNIVTKDAPNYTYLPLCNFDVRIVADVERDDGQSIDRHLAIVGKLHNGRSLPEIVIEASEFSAMAWPISNWGGRASIEPGRDTRDKLRHAIQTLSMDGIKTRRVYTHTGWRVIDGKRAYLHGGGAIGAKNVQVELPDDLKNYILPMDEAIDERTAMRESIKLMDIAPTGVSAPLWAAMFAGPLTEFVTPAFTVWIEGQSGSLKSSYSAVLLNHFGEKFTEHAMPADWQSTGNSLEKLAFYTKDAPLIIDDLKPESEKSTHKAMNAAVQRVVRSSGNRHGRGRLSGESEFKKTYAPRGVVISTAERNVVGMSTQSRLLTIIVEPGDIDAKKLADAQRQRHIYGYAMAGFIRYCIEAWDDLARRLRNEVTAEQGKMTTDDQHKRHPYAAAVLQVAFDTAMQYAQNIGAITHDDRERRSAGCRKALQTATERQNAATQAQDPALRFMSVLVNLIAQGKVNLPDKGAEDGITRGLGRPSGEILGWVWNGKVNLLPAAYKTIYEYCEREGSMFSSDRNTLERELAEKGFIARGKDEYKVSQKNLVGKAEKVYVVSQEKLFEVVNAIGLLPSSLWYEFEDDGD